MRSGLVLASLIAAVAAVAGQAPPAGPTFDVVSIRPSEMPTGGGVTANVYSQRPDGGVTMTRIFASALVSRAYGPMSAADIIGLPEWARRQFYDISATASLARPTDADRTAMLRAMLADRFQLQVHTERREVPSFDLLLARGDGKLGPGLVPSDVDCEALAAARRAEAEAAMKAGKAPPPQPTPNLAGGELPRCFLMATPTSVRGEMAIANIVGMLRSSAGRLVVDKTGLRGTYRVDMKFGAMPLDRSSPAPAGADEPLSVFTAVREQLWLRLEPSRTEHEVLVIDRIEPPTAN